MAATSSNANRTRACLAVDLGNTAMKLAWFEAEAPPPSAGSLSAPRRAGRIPTRTFGEPESLEQLEEFRDSLGSAPVEWVVASVHRGAEQRLAEWARRRRPEDPYRLLTWRDAPLPIEVEAPERVGLDRVMGAVAAARLRAAGEPAVILDLGTAAKVNLLAPHGAFAGGAILPGLVMAAESLRGGTDLLPEIGFHDRELPPPALGRNTEQAIRGGLYWGLLGGVAELARRILPPEFPAAPVFLTGGDAPRFAAPLRKQLHPHPVRYCEHLVAAGIREAARSHGGG